MQTPVASFSLDVKSTLFRASERRIDTRVNILAHRGNQHICRSSLRDRVYRDCSGRGGLGSAQGVAAICGLCSDSLCCSDMPIPVDRMGQ
jgi:hypothetical protein